MPSLAISSSLNINVISSQLQLYFDVAIQTYQDNLLLGKTLDNLYYDGKLLIPVTEWTFDSITGTITFLNVITPGINCLAQYH